MVTADLQVSAYKILQTETQYKTTKGLRRNKDKTLREMKTLESSYMYRGNGILKCAGSKKTHLQRF